jgi:hypothetical protein
MLLFAGKYVKADTPCHVAITSYEKQIDSLETRLATAQSLPYNQGDQEGYKVAKLEVSNKAETIGWIAIAVIVIWFTVKSLIFLKNN